MSKLRVLSLFAGIGGFDLGLERTGGFETVAFCEIDPFCQRVLAKHWPDVPCYPDVRELTSERLAADGIAVDVICGGFPCQDISTSGTGAGLAGARSGLWSEIARLASELRPRYILVENVAALLGRGLGTVLGDLASLGYDAEWHCIPAAAVGAPHRRDRIWIVAYPMCVGHIGQATPEAAAHHQERDIETSKRGRRPVSNPLNTSGEAMADAARNGWERGNKQNQRRGTGTNDGVEFRRQSTGSGADRGTEIVANASSLRQQGQGQGKPFQRGCQATDGEGQANQPLSIRLGGVWPTEPGLGRVANGVPDRTHRLKALGNAVVPQIPELIGNAILESMAA